MEYRKRSSETILDSQSSIFDSLRLSVWRESIPWERKHEDPFYFKCFAKKAVVRSHASLAASAL
jgi:hypothetical protein